MQATKIQIVDVFKPLYQPKRYKVYYGGRGGAKSWAFAQAILIQGTQQKMRILCTRELQGSIRESVHKLLSDTIERLNLSMFYEVAINKIVGKNGTEIIFEGLKNNTTAIKSMENIHIVWCEEAEAITEYSWDLLIPTIRAPGSEIWISFNPFDEMDATYQKFVDPYLPYIEKDGFYEDSNIFVSKVGYQHNPWFPAELQAEMEACKRDNHRKYLHIWEGECSADFDDSIIQPEWVEAAIDSHQKLGFKPRGIRSLGYDPADEGTDDKAYCIRHGSVVTHCENWVKGDVEESTVKAWEAAEAVKCTDFVYDNIGVGSAVKIILRGLQGNSVLNIRGFCSSHSPDYPESKYKGDRKNLDVFANIRAQYWWLLADRFENTYKAIEKGEYLDPDQLISLDSTMKNLKLLKSELTRVQRKRGNYRNSLILVESKQDMKKRGLRSPGLADSLVYCFANKEKKRHSGPIDYRTMNRGIV